MSDLTSLAEELRQLNQHPHLDGDALWEWMNTSNVELRKAGKFYYASSAKCSGYQSYKVCGEEAKIAVARLKFALEAHDATAKCKKGYIASMKHTW